MSEEITEMAADDACAGRLQDSDRAVAVPAGGDGKRGGKPLKLIMFGALFVGLLWFLVISG